MKINSFLDVHSLNLEQAKKVILREIHTLYENDICVLHVNHGFNNGQRIKSWCLREGLHIPHVIKVESGENEGITTFCIESNWVDLKRKK